MDECKNSWGGVFGVSIFECLHERVSRVRLECLEGSVRVSVKRVGVECAAPLTFMYGDEAWK